MNLPTPIPLIIRVCTDPYVTVDNSNKATRIALVLKSDKVFMPMVLHKIDLFISADRPLLYKSSNDFEDQYEASEQTPSSPTCKEPTKVQDSYSFAVPSMFKIERRLRSARPKSEVSFRPHREH